MKDYYIKKGRKYIPIGVCELRDNIPYGVWYVRKTIGGTSHTNLDFWETGEVLDIKKMCKQIDLAEKLAKALLLVKRQDYNSTYEFAKKLSQELIRE